MSLKQPNSSNEASTRNRFPGTSAFTDSAEDRARYFGRPTEAEELYLRVLSVPFCCNLESQGLAKLHCSRPDYSIAYGAKHFCRLIRLNVEEESLTHAVARSIRLACNEEGLEFTEGRTDGLWELLSTTMVWRDDLLLTPVLVFDQFEEVFTLHDADFRATLAAEIGVLITGIAPERLRAGKSGIAGHLTIKPNVKIVISIREDYLGALQEFSEAIPGLFHERLRLEPLTEKSAREAITKPAQLIADAGEMPYWTPPFNFDKAALDSIIDYL
jgi:hypothetical protein